MLSCTTGGDPVPKFTSIEGHWSFEHNLMVGEFTIERIGNQSVITNGTYSVRFSKDNKLHPFSVYTPYREVDSEKLIKLIEIDPNYYLQAQIKTISDDFKQITVANLQSNSLRTEFPSVFELVIINRTP